jgi:hypothetical protein
VQLSSGVPDVLKLSQANISEDTIIAYVQASDRSYGGMSASEIVYLHEQGVSDSIVNAMLNQGKQMAAAAQTTQPASVTQATTEANATTSAAQCPQAYVPPTVTSAQPAPTSTVYVAPNSPPVVDYGYYPGYGYYGYYYPPVSFSFGFGGGYRGGYYYGGGGHGGYHGEGYHGGGGHGGGGHR